VNDVNLSYTLTADSTSVVLYCICRKMFVVSLQKVEPTFNS